MTKNSGGKFDDYLISPKIRQILLHWGYELKKEDLLQFFLIKILIFLLYKRSVSINSTKKNYWKKQKKIFFKKKLLNIIYWTKKQLNKRRKIVQNMTKIGKQAKKEHQKNYYETLKAYKDELLLGKAK